VSKASFNLVQVTFAEQERQ